MFTGLQGQKIMYTTLFMGKVCRKISWFRYRQNRCNVWADSVWLCIFHFPLCIRQGIKVAFKNKPIGPHSKKLGHPVFFFFSFFFSLTFFFRLIPWNTEALCVHFPAWASKTWTGRRSASSLLQETRRAPAAYVNRASPLSWGFIGFLCKQRNISFYSFLSSIILSATFFLYLSLCWRCHTSNTLDPTWAGPWQHSAPGLVLLTG